ncbi:endonuclease/exonuclease/phosphatase family protein [Lacibacterium aquatile]|uniref:Endonuclease/exonuclease/phosphatase family protein n=1 Tax=Lacibacterium aquatile TaxID=1168082 RepID=A0ABW5DXB7_9PROT
MRFALTTLAGALLSALPLSATAQTLRIATWNLGFLTEQPDQVNADFNGPVAVRRSPEHFARLARYAERLDADIIAIEEVENEAVARLVFDPTKYEIFLTNEQDHQRVGFAVRHGVVHQKNPTSLPLFDVLGTPDTPPTQRSLRQALQMTVQFGGLSIEMLAVHLKSRCAREPVSTANDHCPDFAKQVPVLKAWLKEQHEANKPFIVLGDFNREFEDIAPQGNGTYLVSDDEVWKEMLSAAPDLVRTTAGQRSHCWGAYYAQFIDHIVLDGQAAKLLRPYTFYQMVFDEQPRSDEEGRYLREYLSDHCPASVLMQQPKNP